MDKNFLGIPVAAWVVGLIAAAFVFVTSTVVVLSGLNDLKSDLHQVLLQKEKVKVVMVTPIATPSATLAPATVVKPTIAQVRGTLPTVNPTIKK